VSALEDGGTGLNRGFRWPSRTEGGRAFIIWQFMRHIAAQDSDETDSASMAYAYGQVVSYSSGPDDVWRDLAERILRPFSTSLDTDDPFVGEVKIYGAGRAKRNLAGGVQQALSYASGHGPMRLIDLGDVLPDPWRIAREQEARERRASGRAARQNDSSPRPAHRPSQATNSTPGNEPGKARLRIFVCGSCSTAEVVPWCGQNPDCGHPECADALARYAAPHRLDGRCFHGQVNVIMIEPHLWNRYDNATVETDTGIRPARAAEMFTDAVQDNRQSIARLKASPFIPHKEAIRGLSVRRGDRAS